MNTEITTTGIAERIVFSFLLGSLLAALLLSLVSCGSKPKTTAQKFSPVQYSQMYKQATEWRMK